jgi:hypothetical protein
MSGFAKLAAWLRDDADYLDWQREENVPGIPAAEDAQMERAAANELERQAAEIERLTNHPERLCQICQESNQVWSAPDDLWNEIAGSPNGIWCARCFVKELNRLRVAEIERLRGQLQRISRIANGDWGINARLSMEEIAAIALEQPDKPLDPSR